MPDEAPPIPFVLTSTEAARKRFADAHEWVRGLAEPFGGEEAARHFSDTLARELTRLTIDLAGRFASGSNLPRIDEEASLAFSRPAYRHTFTTAGSGKRRRGQSAGVWFLFYDLPRPGMVQVLFLRHGAAEPLTADF